MNEQLMQQIKQLVDAAKAGDQKATQQVQQIMQAAQQGDQQAMQLAQIIQQMIQSAKQGAKLAYMRSLNRICNPGEQLVYMKAGGKTTCGCQKKPEVAKAGTQIKKKGGCSKAMNGIKAEMMKDGGKGEVKVPFRAEDKPKKKINTTQDWGKYKTPEFKTKREMHKESMQAHKELMKAAKYKSPTDTPQQKRNKRLVGTSSEYSD